jgi:hypothetical protein
MVSESPKKNRHFAKPASASAFHQRKRLPAKVEVQVPTALLLMKNTTHSASKTTPGKLIDFKFWDQICDLGVRPFAIWGSKPPVREFPNLG